MKQIRMFLFFKFSLISVLIFSLVSCGNSEGVVSEIDGIWLKNAPDFTKGFQKAHLISIKKGKYLAFYGQGNRSGNPWDIPKISRLDVYTEVVNGKKYLSNGKRLRETYSLTKEGNLRLGRATFYPASKRVKNILSSILKFEKDPSVTKLLWTHLEKKDDKGALKAIQDGAWVDAGFESGKKPRAATLAIKNNLSAEVLVAIAENSFRGLPTLFMISRRPQLLKTLIEGKHLDYQSKGQLTKLLSRLVEENSELAILLAEKYGTKVFSIDGIAYKAVVNASLKPVVQTILDKNSANFSQYELSHNLEVLVKFFNDDKLADLLGAKGYVQVNRATGYLGDFMALAKNKFSKSLAVLVPHMPKEIPDNEVIIYFRAFARLGNVAFVEDFLLNKINFSVLPQSKKKSIKDWLKAEKYKSLREKLGIT